MIKFVTKKNQKILILVGGVLIINLLLIVLLTRTAKESILNQGPLPAKYSKPSSPTPIPRLATFSISPSSITTSAEQNFTVNLNLETAFSLRGADAVINFDPEQLTIKKVAAGKTFSLYPRLTYDNDKGRIIITGINLDSAKSSDQNSPAPLSESTFAILTITSKKIGRTNLQFDFEYGKTNKSTVISKENAQNILTHVQNARIEIK